jgi:catechol 2,3-dioxygenase-like lactoylglutathione lyase family enzyme
MAFLERSEDIGLVSADPILVGAGTQILSLGTLPMVIPTAILETVIYCDDLDRARQFYQGVIGLPLVSEEPGRHLFFRVGTSMLLIFNPRQTRSATVRVGDQIIPRHGSDGPSHFAFQIDPAQLEAVKTNLRREGVEIESEIDWPSPPGQIGGHSIYCRDPAGNSVEFATRSLWFGDETGV